VSSGHCVPGITGNVVPDHATVARLIRRHQESLNELFGSVLRLCARAGLVDSGVVAVDGTKLTASASSDSNVDYDRIAREIIAEAIATDEGEDEQHGDARGDELPLELQTEAGRREWLERELAREQAEGENDPGECVEETVGEFDPERIGRTGRRGWLREAHRHLEAQRWEVAQPIPRSRAERLRLGARFLEDELARTAAATQPMRTFGSIAGCMTSASSVARPSLTRRPRSQPAR
jgi:hypothetical protein